MTRSTNSASFKWPGSRCIPSRPNYLI
jgi:hypothetical protein